MKLKKSLALLLSLCMVLTLCACNKEDKDVTNANPSQQSGQNGTVGDQQNPADSQVNFGLQSAPTPDFDSPATGDDSGKLYTIVGDYAYELDPATLQPIGDPLDPVTHQPVSNPVLEGENPSTPNNPQNQTQEPATQPTEPSTPPESDPPAQTEEPAQQAETKLPNTGMFLEDD